MSEQPSFLETQVTHSGAEDVLIPDQIMFPDPELLEEQLGLLPEEQPGILPEEVPGLLPEEKKATFDESIKSKDLTPRSSVATTLNWCLATVKERGGLILTVAVALAILLAPSPAPVTWGGQTYELTEGAHSMLALLGALIVGFITEAFPVGATMGIVYGWIILFGVVEPVQASAIFSHDAAWFLIGALMIAQVLVKYNLHKRVLLGILKVAGNRVHYVILGIITFCALSSSFIADHTIAALMLPVGITIIQGCGGPAKVPNLTKLLLFSIAYGATIGGLGAPSGGGRNVVMIGLLQEQYGVHINYGSWMIMAMPIVFLLIPCVWFVLTRRFKPEVTDLGGIGKDLKQEMKVSPMGVKEWSVLSILLIILSLWLFASHLGIGMIALVGSVLYLLTGLVRWQDYQGIDWGVGLLYFGAMGLGSTLLSTGAAAWVAAQLLLLLNPLIATQQQLVITMIGAVVMVVTTQCMSGGPAVAVTGSVLLETANLTGVDPIFLGISLPIAASFAYLAVISAPPNAIVYGSGYIKARDFLRAGVGLDVLSIAVMGLVAYFWWEKVLGVGINGFH